MPIQLFGHPWSINTRKVLAAVAEKGQTIPLTVVAIPAGEHKRPEYLRLHPFGKVPALDDDGFVIYEARAITAYLDATLPGPALTPRDARSRARMDQWINAADAYFVPLVAPMIVELLFRRYLGGDTNEAAIAAGRAGLAAPLDVVDRALGSAPFLAGDAFSLADLHWMPYLEYLDRLGEGAPVAARPHLAAWWRRVADRASWHAVARSGPQPYDADVIAKQGTMTAPLGSLFAYWRGVRRMSQLALATEAEVSPRHLSFIESGRAKPSREMVLHLASVLDVPLRERNRLLAAAGFANAFRESELDAPELAVVNRAIDAILAHHMPHPAVVLDRVWNLVRMNPAADELFSFLLAGSPPMPGVPNVLRAMFHPHGVRPHVENWEEIAESFVQRAHREAAGHVVDDELRRLLAEVLSYPGVPERWRRADLAGVLLPVIPVRFSRDGRRLAYFSTVTTLGTPIDVTAQEIRIECFFPA